MLHVFTVPLVAVQGAGCAQKSRWVAVRVSLYYAPCLSGSSRPKPMLYRSAPTPGGVHDTLPVGSCMVMTDAHIAENDRIICPQETTRTILELGD